MSTNAVLDGVATVTDPVIQERGQQLARHIHAALRVLKIYPIGNNRCVGCLDDIRRCIDLLVEQSGVVEIRVAGEFLFVNDARLRLGLDNFASLSHVINTFHRCGIGCVIIQPDADQRQWQVFVSALIDIASREDEAGAVDELLARLNQAAVTAIEVHEASESEQVSSDERIQKAVAKHTYQRSVQVTKDLVSSVRMGRATNLRKIKRAVQNIVDQVLNNQTSMIGLTTLRDYDAYSFTHSVNVCIFSLAIAKRLGLQKSQLYDLGVAALLHDLGKSRVPLEVLNKTGGLSDEEWNIMKSHSWLGVLSLFGVGEGSEIPYRAMIVAHQHHMKTDLTGYPRSPRTEKLSMYAKLVTVADIYDAATSKRVYNSGAGRPDRIIQEFVEQSDQIGVDQLFVKALINVLGVYPVGTCVLLDTYEVAIVHAANMTHGQPNRPVVRIIFNDLGVPMDPPPLVDLTKELGPGVYERSIIKVVDPERYGVTPSDFFI